MIIILAQCACGKEWYKKQTETPRYESYLQFYRLNPIHSLFIPYDLIDTSEHFFQDDEIVNKLIFSRRRIIEYCGEADYFENLDSFKAINKCLELLEDTT